MSQTDANRARKFSDRVDQADRCPSPRRRARAGAVVVLIVMLIIAVLFVGRNIGHYRELQEQHETGGGQHADPVAPPHP